MSGNPNLKQALKRAEAAGLRVEKLRNTGEVRVWGKEPHEVHTLNIRKKSSPRVLLALLRKYE